MTPEIAPDVSKVVQYGALGLLAALLLGGMPMAFWIVRTLAATHNSLVTAIKELVGAVTALETKLVKTEADAETEAVKRDAARELAAERRHGELRIHIETVGKETRTKVSQAMAAVIPITRAPGDRGSRPDGAG